jgi:RNA polymerase sigma-70 factor (ECF subfamily)
MIAAQKGDESAYTSLLLELKDAIRAYLIARFGYTNVLDDCVQDCLLSVHQARHTYNRRRPFRPWLFAIVRNKMIDHLRKVRPAITLDPALQSYEPDFDGVRDSEKLLGQLSANMREPLFLTRFVGLSTRECADQLGVSENVVKVRIHRGIRKLRALWEAEAS